MANKVFCENGNPRHRKNGESAGTPKSDRLLSMYNDRCLSLVNFLLILPMLMFGEGFLNGAMITLAVSYKPQWVATFHDRWYLQGK